MMFDFLSEDINSYLKQNINDIYEIRIRKNMPLSVRYKGKIIFPKIGGREVIFGEYDIQKIVSVICKNSLYKYNDTLQKGYLYTTNGARIGVGGECVCDHGKVITIKNFSSLCIRISHDINGFANNAFNIINCDNNMIKNLLIISPPGSGKTTLLRDLTRIISNIKSSNILVVDEKNEIFYEGCIMEKTIDVLYGCDKKFGFYSAIKALSPDVIVCDELMNEEDAEGVLFASSSGVNTICSVHGKSIDDLYKKDFMRKLFTNKVFEKYILLNRRDNVFTYKEIFP